MQIINKPSTWTDCLTSLELNSRLFKSHIFIQLSGSFIGRGNPGDILYPNFLFEAFQSFRNAFPEFKGEERRGFSDRLCRMPKAKTLV